MRHAPDGALVLGLALGLVLLLGACSNAPATAPWIELFDGRSLEHWTVTEFGGEGEVTIHDAALQLDLLGLQLITQRFKHGSVQLHVALQALGILTQATGGRERCEPLAA